jgi:hypothetical protein
MMDNAYLLSFICGWLDQVARDRLLVISCSYRSRGHNHDGNTVEERQLNARFTAGVRGRALCIAAGNDGLRREHAEVHLGPGDVKGHLAWTAPGPASLRLCFDTNELAHIQIKEPKDNLIAQKSLFLHNLTHTVVAEFQLRAGPGELDVSTDLDREMRADAYIASLDFYGPQADFDARCFTRGKQIDSPGAAAQAITVGSYDWNDQFNKFGTAWTMKIPNAQGKYIPMTLGGLSLYSNPGPNRMGNVVKPDIVAPGQWYTAPDARNISARLESTGYYRLFNRTSAATPYCAGVVALLMQKKPDITLGEIKNLLKKCATQDDFTGKVPNGDWGYGKLDIKAVQKMLAEVSPAKHHPK